MQINSFVMLPGAFTGKRVLKWVIFKSCRPKLQHRLRRMYSLYQIMHNTYSREPEMALIGSLVQPGDYVADIGANVGVYTRELSLAVGQKGKVYSFEPLRENYDILAALLRKARLDNVFSYRAAVGSRETQCEMLIPEMSGFTGFYWAHLASPGDKGGREMVDVLMIDELFKHRAIDHLDFIKCDVEGGELEVLRGAINLVHSHRPGWLMEVSRETSEEIFRLFHELGYQAFVYSGQLIPVDAYRDREFSNYFFLHPQSRNQNRRQ